MFQPQPTPFASFYSAGFADDTIPGYSSSPYQQGPLGGPRPGPGGGPGPGDANGGGHGHGHGHGQGLQGLGAHQQQQHGGAPPSGGAPLSIYPFSSLNLGPAATSQDLFNNQQPFSPLNNPLDSSFKMESGGHDLAAQEAAAREFKPQLEVRRLALPPKSQVPSPILIQCQRTHDLPFASSSLGHVMVDRPANHC